MVDLLCLKRLFTSLYSLLVAPRCFLSRQYLGVSNNDYDRCQYSRLLCNDPLYLNKGVIIPLKNS